MAAKDNYLVDGYLPTIGIECHVQLNTITKLFTGVSNDAVGAAPNTKIGPLCIGLPGSLPVVNSRAIEKGIIAGLALNAGIASVTKFDRKHYFYPDSPLGYQITQFDKPIVQAGSITIQTDSGEVKVGIERAHLESDAGKLSHPVGADYSLVDLNRAGTPLLEIVSDPDMHSPQEAKLYAKELYLRMLYAGVSECDLSQGNIRFDVNVSVSKDGTLGTRTETKNLNSFRNIEKTVFSEVRRQIDAIEAGEIIVQETRGWDDDTQSTFSQRTKEDAHDYRYMPDPDIPPIQIDPALVESLRANMPIGPQDVRKATKPLDLKGSSLTTLLDNPPAARMAVALVDAHDKTTAKTIVNWLIGEILHLVSDNQATWKAVMASEVNLVKLASMVSEDKLSSTNAKELLKPVVVNNVDPLKLAEEADMLQVSDVGELAMLVEKLVTENPKALADAKEDPKAIGFFVGQAMKATQGKANPKVIADLLKKHL